MAEKLPWLDDEQWRVAEARAAAAERKQIDPKREAAAAAAKLAVPWLEPTRQDPGELALTALENTDGSAFLAEGKAQGKVRRIDPSEDWESFGFVGAFAEVVSEQSFVPGLLVVVIDAEQLGSVAVETLRMFRWDDDAGILRLVPSSGVGRTAPYAWAWITQPGSYAVVGLNADLLVLRAIRALYCLHSVLAIAPDIRDPLLECLALVIAQPASQGLDLSDPEVLTTLSRDHLAAGVPVPPFDRKRPAVDYAALSKRFSSLRMPAGELPEFQLLTASAAAMR